MEDFLVHRKKTVWLTALAAVLAFMAAAKNGAPAKLSGTNTLTSGTEAATATGIFAGHGDVGTVLHSGSVEYDAGKQIYTVSGSGENMWFGSDAFQFAWKQMSGDVTLTADIAFLGKGVNEHRKAVLMIRQSLDADSPYADVALHGSGLTSLQFREEKGAATHEIQANTSAPKRLRIEKHGDSFSMWLAEEGGTFHLASGSTRIALKGPFYAGIGVCSHDKDVVEKAVFSNVEWKIAGPASAGASAESMTAKRSIESMTAKRSIESMTAKRSMLYSTLEIITVASTDRRVVIIAPERLEAPNWMPDGKFLLFNRDGHIEKIPVTGGTAQILDTGFATRCNNDHGISPDGKQLAISDQSQEEHESLVYIVPIGGAHRGGSRRSLLLTGTGGRPTEKHWRLSARETASSIFIRFPPPGERRHD